MERNRLRGLDAFPQGTFSAMKAYAQGNLEERFDGEESKEEIEVYQAPHELSPQEEEGLREEIEVQIALTDRIIDGMDFSRPIDLDLFRVRSAIPQVEEVHSQRRPLKSILQNTFWRS